jgi:hypothetical protein
LWSPDITAGIATGFGLDDREVEVQVPIGPGILFPYFIHIGFEAYPFSYITSNMGVFHGAIVAET